MAAPFQPPATAPTPAPTPAPPTAPTPVRVPGVAQAARTANKATEERIFRMVTSFTVVRWLASTASSTTVAGPGISGIGEQTLACPAVALRAPEWTVLVAALAGRVRQVRGAHAHAEAARQAQHEPEVHRRPPDRPEPTRQR